MRRRRAPDLTALLAAAALTGCAVGPRFAPPAPPETQAYLPPTIAVPMQVILGEVLPRWWTAYNSPALDTLVETALASNSDLKVAEATLRQAREQSFAASSALRPVIDASVQSERSKSSQYLSPILNQQQFLFNLQTAQLSINYPLDLFGGTRHRIESSRAGGEAQFFRTAAARLTLTTNTVLAALQEASLRQQLAAARRSAAFNTQSLTLFQRRQQLGAIGLADVATQAAALGQSEAAIPPLERALAHQQAALSILLGREPSLPLPAAVDLDQLTLPATVPLRLPSELVRQRPDIRAAAAQLHGASADVGVAIAARLPAIVLSAAAGGAAPNFADLFRNGNPFWQIIGGLTQPLFHGGQLRHQQRAAEAVLDGAKAQYRSTVLTAFADVADALTALRTDAAAVAATTHADTAAQQSLRFTLRQSELGSVDKVATLIANTTAAQTALQRIQARTAQLSDYTALVQAVGGPANDSGV